MSSVTFLLRRKNRERSMDLLIDHLDFHWGSIVGQQWDSGSLCPYFLIAKWG